MYSLSRKGRNVWGLEVREEVGERRGRGDKAALSGSVLFVADMSAR